jgi:hypothetical protein
MVFHFKKERLLNSYNSVKKQTKAGLVGFKPLVGVA